MFRNSLTLLPLLAGLATAQTIQPPFVGHYTLVDLGVPTGVPTAAGGLTISAADPNQLLIAGRANSAQGAVFSVPVQRDAQGHIVGFAGTATTVSTAPSVDGTLVYGPGNVLFYSRYPSTAFAQVRPGSQTADKLTDLAPFGVGNSVSSINFVPAGYPGAGRCKIAMFPNGQWWDVTLTPDGLGSFNAAAATQVVGSLIPGAPEGFAYVPLGSPLFPFPSMVVTEWNNSSIVAYTLDAEGNPKPATRSVIASGLGSVEGSSFDPVSGDLLVMKFSTAHLYIIRGFGPQSCTANCDGSVTPPILNANDFQCFLNAFAAGSPAANCDASTVAPVLNANDFQCFLNKFAQGCAQ